MWLLADFKSEFNVKNGEIKTNTPSKNSIWQVEDNYTPLITGVEWFMIRNNQKAYDLFAWNEAEYVKTTHKLRLAEQEETIKKWFAFYDDNGNEYKIMLIEEVPWFWWITDHLLLFIDRVEYEWS